MCGITGVIIGKDANIKKVRRRFTALLKLTESRGIDAAGAYVYNGNGEVFMAKNPVRASTFVQSRRYMGLMQTITKDTLHVVGHTRAATQGTPKDNTNNHPILDGNWIGVHNGVIYNDISLALAYGTSAEVDSAVIFSMLNAETEDHPVGRKRFATLMGELDGSFAVAATDLRSDKLFLARNRNPIVLMVKEGCLWFNSEARHLETVFGLETNSPLVEKMYPNSVMLATTTNAEGTPLRHYPIRHEPAGGEALSQFTLEEISPSVYDYIEQIRRKRGHYLA